MFRKLRDKIASTLDSPSQESSHPTSVRSITKQLTDFGFTLEQARQAAVAAGTFEGALEILTAQDNAQPNRNVDVNESYENDMARAIAASLSSVDLDQQGRARQSGASAPQRGAAVAKAAAAAEARASKNNRNKSSVRKSKDSSRNPSKKVLSKKISTPSTGEKKSTSPVRSHPNVKVPLPLASAPLHKQFERCALRLAPYPRALDTLRRTLTKLAQDPYNPTFKTIETGTGTMFDTVLGDAPGASEMLRAVGFIACSSPKPQLHIFDADEVVIAMAISALEEIKKSPEYLSAKKLINFSDEVKKEVENDNNLTGRVTYREKVPPEPEIGTQSTTIRMVFHPKLTVSRRFDGDDTCGDVINWVGTHSPVIAERLWEGKW
eukprot:CAMPEP_0113311550 /NCGR_PEP_ID=MMETSP0010_2-20120614/8743_1 /TAXON_ID=216773 ORGANISM="Corethron hystrix, Strain 308" /NCGR_SAMPLE_ID=MMETSP0010_2 /ASSEMBLY_ACC=CAM_ASM_000155 /LENGTH=378 /DNA_ID=CAMNT_0000167213 /DNA_START=116 /DNA_END=1249 /DNA_ORIENTATION=+ /assembly_acc=CAM_ASM_000155